MDQQSIQLDDFTRARQRTGATRRLHVLALLTTVATFPLIFMGGLVTSHHAGMSVPDWPNSYGYNMFLFPPSQWVGGIFYEHTHRLAGTVVGFLSLLLTLFAWGVAEKPKARLGWIQSTRTIAIMAVLLACLGWFFSLSTSQNQNLRGWTQVPVALAGLALAMVPACFATAREPRRWVRWLATGVLGMVLFQGVLGGLRVVLVKLDLAIFHACVAQAFFCLAALTAVVTSRWWFAAENPPIAFSASGRRLVVLGVVTTVTIFLQLIVGAMMRHFDAGLAIPDLPLAYGHLLPLTSKDALAAINHHRTFDLGLDSVTLGQIWVHFAHRIGAVLVSGLAITLAITVFRRHGRTGLVGPAVMLMVLLIAQVTLGVLTVLLRKPADVASAHVATGALVLVTSFVLTVRAMRRYRAPWHTTLKTASDRVGAAAGDRSHDRPAGLVTT